MRILIVEDERLLRVQLKNELEHPSAQNLDSQKYQIVGVANFSEAQGILQAQAIDIAFIDLNLGLGGDRAGIKLLELIRKQYPSIVPIVMTGTEDSSVVEECLKLGAADYIFKPFDPRIVHHLLIKAIVHHKLFRKTQTLRAQGGDRIVEPKKLVSKSPAFQKVIAQAEKLRGKNLSVLITGETGTGKEVMAQYLWSQESDSYRPFIPVHCGAISENLVESALFGHVKGAFTGALEDKKGFFEDADGGDIFLDEIGTMPIATQAKLLRVLNSGDVTRVGATRGRKFDFRVIAATNEDLTRMSSAKSFREDLLFRVNQVELKLPPLRKRKEDIADLVQLFLQQSGNGEKKYSPDAMELAIEYPWPGNIRQLEKVVTVSGALTEGDVISRKDLERQLNLGQSKSSQSSNSNDVFSIAPNQVQGRFQTNVEELEKAMLQFALKNCKNESEAARYLGIPRNSLIRRIREWGN
jgi:DNA-binding NtrC family response regulator